MIHQDGLHRRGTSAVSWLPAACGFFLPWALLAAPAPLLIPSQVSVRHYRDVAGDVVKLRRLCIPGADRGTAKVHLDMYFYVDAAEKRLTIPQVVPDELQRALVQKLLIIENTTELCPMEDDEAWRMIEISRKWRVGHHPAVICQVDDYLSIADEVRSGRLVNELFKLLYSHESNLAGNLTGIGINFGAGTDSDIDTDPLYLWTQEYAKHVTMIDGDSERLVMALNNLKFYHGMPMPLSEHKSVNAIAETVTPEDVDNGWVFRDTPVDGNIGIDVLKIDIDSFDCAILQAVVRQFDVAVIVMESQPMAPPPIKFARMWHPEDKLTHGFYGCSLSYQLRVLHPAYNLLVYTEDDTIFVHSRIAKTLEQLSVLQPGRVLPWTAHPLQFPIDEIDCYRRSRTVVNIASRNIALEQHLAGTRYYPAKDVRDFSVEMLREWAIKLHPHEALARLWGNLTTYWDLEGGHRMPEIYSLDL